jgi:integrase
MPDHLNTCKVSNFGGSYIMINERFYKYSLMHGRESSFAKHRGTTITEMDEALIRQFVDELMSTKNVGEMRADKIVVSLIQWRRFITREYKGITINDVHQGISRLKHGKNERGRPYKANTYRDFIAVIKQFLRWMMDNNLTTIDDKSLKKIVIPPKDYETTAPQDLPTADEIKTIILSCKTMQQKAFISTLYESAVRIGELGRLTWQDVVFDEYGVKLYIDDKKRKQKRYSRLTMSTEFLAQWKNYVRDSSPEAFVFSDRSGQPLTYAAGVQRFSRIITASGIKKHITPHDFRRARATHMIQQNYQESVIKKSIWGNLDSEQFKVYVKLQESDIDNEFLRKAGISTEKAERINPLGPRPCPVCHFVNSGMFDHCGKCGSPLTKEAIAKHKRDEEEAAKLAVDPDVLKKMIDDAVNKRLESMQQK